MNTKEQINELWDLIPFMHDLSILLFSIGMIEESNELVEKTRALGKYLLIADKTQNEKGYIKTEPHNV